MKQQSSIFVIYKILEEKGFLLKEGTIVDATILVAPSSTKNAKKERDPEMSSTKKGSMWYFGMKAHVGVDDKSGLVHTLKTTTAKVHDHDVMEELWHEKERRKLGNEPRGSRGLFKNTMQLFSLFTLNNLFRVRKKNVKNLLQFH